MKTTFQFFAILFCVILITGCSKTGDVVLSPEAQVVKYLTGGINRVWRLNQLFVKGVEQTLTGDQKKYTKTFTVDPAQKLIGAYTDSDGNYGEWFVTGGQTFQITFTTSGGGQYVVPYTIRGIGDDKLDIQYTLNQQTIREVYYAY